MDIIDLTKEKLVGNYRFEKIGEYSLQNNDMISNDIGFTKEVLKVREKLVYAFVVDDLVMYIGKTKRGFKRPLSYHKDYNNPEKKRAVHERIREVIRKNKIEIFARVFEGEIKVENIEIMFNPYVCVEEALIKEFQPKWNKEK